MLEAPRFQMNKKRSMSAMSEISDLGTDKQVFREEENGTSCPQ